MCERLHVLIGTLDPRSQVGWLPLVYKAQVLFVDEFVKRVMRRRNLPGQVLGTVGCKRWDVSPLVKNFQTSLRIEVHVFV